MWPRRLLWLPLALVAGCATTRQPRPTPHSPSSPFLYTCSRDSLTTLEPVVRRDLGVVARRYQKLTGARFTVTSARRTLRHTAALMAGFSQKQLEGMYCRHGYPSYIRQIVQARKAKKRMLTAAETYDILRRRTEGYISSHLSGGAVDIATRNLAQPELLKRLLRENHFTVLDETSMGVACIHASHRQVPNRIIRE
ncbi:MAG: hypothetical protein IJJ33_21260 [Victivallales bacterium]|nr:hypothetical protein [Victivallales bacterium]